MTGPLLRVPCQACGGSGAAAQGHVLASPAQVRFTPSASHDGPYSQVLPIRINHNSASKEVRCSAAGATPRVAISQQAITCGPTLPNGQAEVTLQVS